MDSNLKQEIENIAYYNVQKIFDEELERRMRSIERKEKPNLFEFMDDHIALSSIIVTILIITICFTAISIMCIVTVKLDVYKMERAAEICVETGYGCTSNTLNKNIDIQYKDTPVIEINKDN